MTNDIRTLGLLSAQDIQHSTPEALRRHVAALQWELALAQQLHAEDSVRAKQKVLEAARVYRACKQPFEPVKWAPMVEPVDAWERFDAALQAWDAAEAALKAAPQGRSKMDELAREAKSFAANACELHVRDFGLVQRLTAGRWAVEVHVAGTQTRAQMFAVTARYLGASEWSETLYTLCRYDRVQAPRKAEELRAWHADERESFPL